jgi:glycine cleavage system regulatory protein
MLRHVLTLIGPDRSGIISTLAEGVRELGGNWRASRLARLAGQFAGVVEFDLPEARAADLEGLLGQLRVSGLAVNVHRGESAVPTGGSLWHIDLLGNDRPGIVREVSRAVATAGGNIEDWESRVNSSPMSGTPLFELQGAVRLPDNADPAQLRRALEALGADLSVDIRLTAD